MTEVCPSCHEQKTVGGCRCNTFGIHERKNGFAFSTVKPLFEENADASLARAVSIYKQRGGEYADTWRTCRFLKLKAVCKALGYKINEEHFRAIATAAFCDMKYERNAGGYKDDSIIDGINYDAFLAEEMRKLNPAST